MPTAAGASVSTSTLLVSATPFKARFIALPWASLRVAPLADRPVTRMPSLSLSPAWTMYWNTSVGVPAPAINSANTVRPPTSRARRGEPATCTASLALTTNTSASPAL
ncbi:hypothetical protein D3C79_765300 [compost metagenome]